MVDSIIRYIKDENLRVGDKLPTEGEFSEFFHVSRTAVREALKALGINGAVESIPGRGTFLRSPITDVIMNRNGVLVMEAQVTITEIMEVRTALELLAADLAIDRGTDEEIEAVDAAMEDLKKAVLSGNPWAQAGTSFHVRIAEMTGNSLLLKTIDSLATTIGQYKDALIEGNTEMQRHIAEHQNILDAIWKRDKEAVHSAIRRHMSDTERDIKRLVDADTAIHFIIK
ncbi:HTH-type transcriptional regulator LutR [bioreactor metagenome]|uniref:HTH-type transcriptional regulator LutR n=1 Tax=bioreactor metagenome TaxID=1076179 RepID=A0A645G2R7_9ZZZZ